ncbi:MULTISPECIES: hypothetical protein [unclassified Streptomyces]|uniref:hypothetical protein n=1 Tax=unclassified Streptomyces TaxID=2593676 RepID=UPI0033CBB3F4
MGYLSTVVLAVLIVVFCLTRIRGPKPLFYVSYRLGLVFNEIPHVALYALAASTALAFSEGDITTTSDRMNVGVAGAAAAGLVVVTLRAECRRRPWCACRLGRRARRRDGDAPPAAAGTHPAPARRELVTRTCLCTASSGSI